MPTRVRSRPRLRPAARTQAGLTRATILAAALRDIDAGGLDAFSIRRLAARLGVYPTAITWHAAGRSDLLAGVVELVFEEGIPRRFTGPWREYLRRLFASFREAIREHPNVAPLVGTQLVSNAGMDFDFVEGLLEALADAGLTGDRLVAGYNAVIAALVGFSTMEFAAEPTEGRQAWQREMSQRLRDVSPTRHPVIAANAGALANRAFILRWESGRRRPMNDAFDAFVELVIAGVEDLARRGVGRPSPARRATAARPR